MAQGGAGAAPFECPGRFEPERREHFDDGWESLGDLPPFKTEIREEHAKAIITYNQSPDIGFDRSINPYRGCEHGCIYCYARPSHAYWGYSAGLDFETKLTAKVERGGGCWRPSFRSRDTCRHHHARREHGRLSAHRARAEIRAPCWRCWSASGTLSLSSRSLRSSCAMPMSCRAWRRRASQRWRFR